MAWALVLVVCHGVACMPTPPLGPTGYGAPWYETEEQCLAGAQTEILRWLAHRSVVTKVTCRRVRP